MAKHKLMSQQTIVVVNSNKGKTYDKCKTQIRKKKKTQKGQHNQKFTKTYMEKLVKTLGKATKSQ